jgi:dipeptidyl aminopeptidase/acylaminoacyl peptidase
MRCLLLFILIPALALSAVAQVKHPFTLEDMMKLKRVGEPEVSPDGRWVIFSVVDVDLQANTKTPHIWIVPLNAHVGPAEQSSAGSSSVERILIPDQDADRPRWAPDGKRFAFLSTKEGGSQVWIADFDGVAGSAKSVTRLTSIATEASGELWSPDGKTILFTSDVYPDCDRDSFGRAEELQCNAKELEMHEKAKVKAQIFEHLLYRHWNAYKEGKRSHIFVISAEPMPRQLPGNGIRFFPLDLTPGDYDAPVFSLGGQDNYAFSPDGQELCYTSNHDKNPAASTNNDLWIVPMSGVADASSAAVLAHPRNITADNPASDSTPLYSPDGRYIAYRAQQRPGYESDRFRLMLYERKTGEKKDLTAGRDHWAGTFVWATDSESIWYSAQFGGNSGLIEVRVVPRSHIAAGSQNPAVGSVVGGPTPDSVVSDMPGKARAVGYEDDPAPTPDGAHILVTRMSISAPNEIYSRGIGAPSKFPVEYQQLTHFNDAVLGQIQTSPIESFRFAGANNDSVQGFLVKPPNFDASKKYPVKFLIHGGPQGAWGDDWSYRWNPELFAAPTSSTSSGYVVIMINFHGSNGYGQKFMDAINGDWGGAPYEDLMTGLDYAEQTYPFIDKNRECALGASYGGYMANWILGHTDRFKCIVSHDGMFNAESAWGTTEELWFNDWEFKGAPYDNRASYEKWSPHQYAKNFKTPTLVIHGQRDYRLDVSEGFQLFTTLQMEGVPSKMLYFPDEGHWVQKPQNSQLWYKTVNDWVDQWTK